MNTDTRPVVRGPFLGLGIGFVAGGIEALALGARTKLPLSFEEAVMLGLVAVLLDGVLGFFAGVIGGAVAELVPRTWLPSRRHAVSMGVAALLVSTFFFVHIALAMIAADRTPAGLAMGLMPLGLGGFFYFNAAYWLRREEVGEEHRVGWRGWSLVAALVLVLMGAIVASAHDAGPEDFVGAGTERPNVLLVTVDTLRRDHVSVYGVSPVRTPTFEDLAEEGVVFLDAVTPLPETAPAHAALFTGRHPIRNGVLSNGARLASSYDTLAETLKDKGYATGAFVSSMALDAHTGLDQGFDVYDDDFAPVRGVGDVLLARIALRGFLRWGDPQKVPWLLSRKAPETIEGALAWQAAAHAPSLLWVHLFEPHAPYEPHGIAGFEDNVGPSVDHRAILREEPGHAYTDDERAKLRRLYQEEVVYTDQQLGALVAAVRKAAPDTVVVVLGDHGEMLGEHGIEMNHHGIYEDAIRVPLLVVPPAADVYRSACGKHCVALPDVPSAVARQVRLMDVPATVLALLGFPAMPQSEGIPLLAASPLDKDLVSLVVGRTSGSLADGLVCGYRTGQIKLLGKALYNLYDDRGETNDIGAAQPQIVEALSERLTAEATGKCGVPATPTSGLKALGYL